MDIRLLECMLEEYKAIGESGLRQAEEKKDNEMWSFYNGYLTLACALDYFVKRHIEETKERVN